ncbi:MAG: prepilin-type N-terminal cleavage/methylation domain-containing protein [Candidatus Riflebacteria bacterium]|nr:prepilin-type N-terminal cleavage/methylation domain-containing protein [Candidatus Riflebacteria bacterium]
MNTPPPHFHFPAKGKFIGDASLKSIFFRHGRSHQGFTLLETMVVVLVGSLILITFQTFFSQGVRSSMKGQDQLESIRAASQLFNQLRKDLMACQSVSTDIAPIILSVNDTSISTPITFGNKVLFTQRNATTTYSMVTLPDSRSYISRQFYAAGVLKESRQFAVPRMEKFETVQIFKDQQVIAGDPVFRQGQLLIRIAVKSNDKRFPGGTVHLSSFFITSQLSATDWWNYYYPGP